VLRCPVLRQPARDRDHIQKCRPSTDCQDHANCRGPRACAPCRSDLKQSTKLDGKSKSTTTMKAGGALAQYKVQMHGLSGRTPFPKTPSPNELQLQRGKLGELAERPAGGLTARVPKR